MSVRRLSQSFLSTRGRGKASSFIAGYGFGVDEMDLLQRVTVGAGGIGGITFSSIPQTYQHLHLRMVGRSTESGSSKSSLYMAANADYNLNYAYHWLTGNGSAASASGAANGGIAAAFSALTGASAGASTFGVVVVDILEYRSTTKFKTFRSLSGNDNNGSGEVSLTSSVWMSTAAITSLVLSTNFNLAQHTVASLYGVVG